MRNAMNHPARLPLLGAAFLGILLMSLAFMGMMDGGSGTVSAESGDPEMVLNVVEGATCDDPVRPTECSAKDNWPFTVSIDAVSVPADGYDAVQGWVTYGDDLGQVKDARVSWPDCDPAVFITSNPDSSGSGNPDSFHALCASGLLEPLPISFYTGILFSFDLTCTKSTTHVLELIPYGEAPAGTSGAAFQDSNGETVPAKVGAPLTINCEPHHTHPTDTPVPTKQPEPGDTDGDGCPDVRENGSDPTLGGQRNYLSPWDFYDVATSGGVAGTDGVIDLLNDIVGVINHYAPSGTEAEYDAHYDRGPSAGPNAWNMAAPDGVIDLLNDIVGVISQAGHDCS